MVDVRCGCLRITIRAYLIESSFEVLGILFCRHSLTPSPKHSRPHPNFCAQHYDGKRLVDPRRVQRQRLVQVGAPVVSRQWHYQINSPQTMTHRRAIGKSPKFPGRTRQAASRTKPESGEKRNWAYYSSLE